MTWPGKSEDKPVSNFYSQNIKMVQISQTLSSQNIKLLFHEVNLKPGVAPVHIQRDIWSVGRMRGRNPKLQEIQELLQFRGNKSIQLYCIKRLLIGLLLSFSPFWMVSNGCCSGTKGSRTEVWPSSRRALTRREPRRERGWSTTSAGQNFSLLLWVFSCNLLIICGSEFFSSLDNPNLGRYMKKHLKTPFVGRHSRKFPNGLEASNQNNPGIWIFNVWYLSPWC